MRPAHEVLVVDDDPDMLDLVLMTLEDSGYQTVGARDGREALERVSQHMPSLILLDMLMPVMDGWEFARRFHDRYGNAAPIVVSTAAENAQERAAAIGADDVLSKPFDLERLLATVDHCCNGCASGHA